MFNCGGGDGAAYPTADTWPSSHLTIKSCIGQ
jgi:hypothetical protein